MISLIVIIVSFVSIILGKYLFKKWFNQISFYSISWMVMIVLYQWKLLPYYNLSLETWMVILLGYLSFLLGIILLFAARSLYAKKENNISYDRLDTLKIFSDGGRVLRNTILIMSILGILFAIQHWIVLIKMFGSIPAVLINANIAYRLRVQGEIKGIIPFFFIFSYVAVFLAGIYSAFKGRLTLLCLLPFLGVIINEMANVGRAGILLASIEFFVAFVLTRNLNEIRSRKIVNGNFKLILSFVILFALIIASASMIKVARGTYESFLGESKQLKGLKNSAIISPSIYMYLSSDLGVLNKYLQIDNENAMIGENTFLVLYSVLSKFNFIKRPSDYQKGYFIPMWSNNGTYLRELHADFGFAGVIVGPFLIGLLTTFLWFKFYENKSMLTLVFLDMFFMIIGFSFLLMVTRFSILIINIVTLIISIPIIESMAFRNSKNLNIKNIDTLYNN